MEVKGKVKFIGVDNQVSASFVKRELVVTTDEQYPQHILINFTQDKVDLLDPLKIGQEVSVSINLRGREWVNPQGETRYFNTIQGWKIANIQPAHHAQGTQPQQAAPTAPTATSPAPSTNFNDDEADDLPF